MRPRSNTGTQLAGCPPYAGNRQATLELKLKAALHQNILQLVKRRGFRARDLEQIFGSQIQQPRVSELMRGKLSALSVARLLLYAELLGGHGPRSVQGCVRW
jgi:predicted XRE-type DNA-binding protein